MVLYCQVNVEVHAIIRRHGLVREYHKPGIKHDLGRSNVRTARKKGRERGKTSHGKEYVAPDDDPKKG